MRKVAKRMKSSEKRLGRNHHTNTIAVAIFFCAAEGQFGVAFAKAMIPPKWQ